LRFISAAAALAIFIASWATLHQDRFKRGEIVDTPVYQNYGDAIWRGEVPYRDFRVEYPPGALPFFFLPAYREAGNVDSFRQSFEALIAACMAVLLIGMALSLAALRASPLRTFGALALAAVAPLLLGSVILSRFDLWPATLVALATAALLSGRLKLGHALLGAGIAAKLWPGVLVPLAVAYAWRTRGRREGLLCLGIAAAVVVCVFLPFVVISPSGVFHSLQTQTTRPLQIETLGAALIVASHHVLGTGVVMSSGHGSQNIGGTAANVVAGIQTAIQVGALLAIWIVFARRERTGEELVRYSAAAVVAFIALGKVLSPQFLIWLIPLVPLVRRWSAAILFAAALVLTQAWFPQHYWDYALRFDETRSWLVLGRDVTLVALLGVLVAPARPYRLRLPRPLRPWQGSDHQHGRSEQSPA
jgi:hypothetical protein